MRKEKKNKRFYKMFAIVMALLTIAFVVFCAAPLFKSRVNIDMTDETTDVFDDEGAKPLYTVENGEILKGIKLSSGNALVTSNSLISYKSDGKVRDITKIGYSNPVAKAEGGRYIVFERSTGKFCLMNKSGIVAKRDSGDEIINCAVSQNGSYAVITKKTQTTCRVSMFNSAGREVFAWECADEYLLDAALSPNGKNLAVSALSVVNGRECAKLYFFSANSTEAEKAVDLGDAVIYKIGFIGNKKVRALTNVSFVTVGFPSGEKKTVDFDYSKILACNFCEGGLTATVMESLGSLGENTVSVYNDSCNTVYSCQVSGDVTDFCVSSNRLYILSGSEISVHNIKSGKVLEPYSVNGGVNSVYVSGGKVYGFSSKSVFVY